MADEDIVYISALLIGPEMCSSITQPNAQSDYTNTCIHRQPFPHPDIIMGWVHLIELSFSIAPPLCLSLSISGIHTRTHVCVVCVFACLLLCATDVCVYVYLCVHVCACVCA